MISADLIITIPHQAGVQYLPAFPHCDLIDTAARGKIQSIILCQQQALHIAGDYARPDQGLEPNTNVTRKLRAGW
jgi:hypothetical protein